MRKIKKFEAFNHRVPTEVDYDEWEKKVGIHGTEPFNKKEIDFFMNLELENKESIYDFHLGTDKCCIEIYPMGDSDNLINIEITKLADDWYIIRDGSDFDPQASICDEWDEVLGYLGTKTNLSF